MYDSSRFSYSTAITSAGLRLCRPWCTQENEAPVQILKFLAIKGAENRDAEGVEAEEKPTTGSGGAS